jgi:hypothetical protein
MSRQWNSRAQRGLGQQLRALAAFEVWCRRRSPVRTAPLSSTVRAEGCPCASTVASVIAVGSGSSEAFASASNRWKVARMAGSIIAGC